MTEIQETSGYYGEHEEFETAEPIHEDPEPSLEEMCIECGKEMINRCGCCGAPLCGMHMETQGGFCSEFTGHEFSEGQVVEVDDKLNDLFRQEVRFTEDAEVQGCLMKSHEPTEKDLLFVMDKLPNGEETPESVLDMDKIEVMEE